MTRGAGVGESVGAMVSKQSLGSVDFFLDFPWQGSLSFFFFLLAFLSMVVSLNGNKGEVRAVPRAADAVLGHEAANSNRTAVMQECLIVC